MSNSSISRRDIIRTLTISAVGSSVLRVIPAEAAEYIHQVVRQEKAAGKSGKYAPKYFTAHQYATLTSLCAAIIPKDEKSAGAVEAGAPEFIDLLTSENDRYQIRLGGGLLWLDGFCIDSYGALYLNCSPQQKKEILDLIAFRRNAINDPTLSQGVAFFALVRNLTCDAFYTSKIGIDDLEYIGNTALHEFPGCPPLPKA
jgi:gluconate 2-dehydrogenase gamma chain